MNSVFRCSSRRLSTAIETTSEASLASEYARPSSGSLSPAAFFGSSRIGQVSLPNDIQKQVQQYVSNSDKILLRQNAQDLYKHLRLSSLAPNEMKAKRALQSDPRPKRALPPYNDETTLAYAAGMMPSVYAATLHVLQETAKKLASYEDQWSPERIIDFGSGTGSAAWASAHVWPTLTQYSGIEPSGSMRAIASRLNFLLPPTIQYEICNIRLPDPSLRTLFPTGPRTLALSAFTLSEVVHPKARAKVINDIWSTGAEVLVFIERGTPAGFALIAQIRSELLQRGRKNEEDVCHVVAPCPHDKKCPLHFSGDFCHFAQRVQRPPFLMNTKHSKRGQEDSKFSYVVLRRTPRGASDMSTDDVQQLRNGPLSTQKTGPVVLEQAEESGSTPLYTMPDAAPPVVQLSPLEARTLQKDSLTWPRLVAPPLKRSGHVILDGCVKSGQIERFIIPKSQGKQEYHDARKASWGGEWTPSAESGHRRNTDSFPHASKHKHQVREGGVRKPRPIKYQKIKPGQFDQLLRAPSDPFDNVQFAED